MGGGVIHVRFPSFFCLTLLQQFESITEIAQIRFVNNQFTTKGSIGTLVYILDVQKYVFDHP